ncbi:MAG: hypothetical protein JST89_00180 [Cyanobacteria bacterium SZAS-4]|nr:hypothetical protein [Cyanobacteria bacterium SZAS-4]
MNRLTDKVSISRRSRGQTLGLVAVVTLVIVVFGIGCYLLMLVMGGSRETANATDAGDLSIAKNALVGPRKKLISFTNPDVQNNFGALTDDGYVDLKVYNRMVGQALLVALNAKDSLSPTAGDNAVKVWRALNDVAQFLRVNQSDKAVMGPYFLRVSDSNNTRMLSQETMAFQDLSVSFMRRGLSTNIAVNPVVLAGYHNDPHLPLNDSGNLSPKFGVKYLSGYKPYIVPLSNGAKIAFSGITMLPGDKPHLVSTGEFDKEREDDFVVGQGVPAYPANTIPSNSFKSTGKSSVAHDHTFLTAVAAAIVGSLDQEYTMSIPNGYIMIVNGPSNPPSSRPASKELDIFSHELATGIATNGSAFANAGSRNNTGGPNGEAVVPASSPSGCWDAWYYYNTTAYPRYQRELAEWQQAQGGNPTIPTPTNPAPQPPSIPCTNGIYSVNGGGAASNAELRSIRTEWQPDCIWTDYSSSPKTICVDELPTFRQAYNRPGSWDNSPYADTGFTNLENFKVAAQASRFNVTTCASVSSPAQPSGVKYFDHSKSYESPGRSPYNFGVEKSPYDYLAMIDQTSGPCALTDEMTFLRHTVDQIMPGAGAGISDILKSKPLKLGQTLYIYRSGDRIVMDASLPPGRVLVPPTSPDGYDWQCGKPYPVIRQTVDTTMDADMPTPYDEVPGDFKCTDKAMWHSSSGYNNLLGVLTFTNQCDPRATFCKPN